MRRSVCCFTASWRNFVQQSQPVSLSDFHPVNDSFIRDNIIIDMTITIAHIVERVECVPMNGIFLFDFSVLAIFETVSRETRRRA